MAWHPYLSEAEFRTALDHDLVDDIDFYWDPAASDVGYHVPQVPSDVDLERDAAQSIRAELDSLARIVSERLEEDYLRRDADEYGFSREGA